MKILSEPSKQDWCIEVECEQCCTGVELEIGDFEACEERGDYTNYACPTCGLKNLVDLTDIPKHFHYLLP